MRAQRQTIKLKDGDVAALQIVRGKCAFRLVIYDEDAALPLIQATLNAAERKVIRKALRPG